nr:MAG TPA: hypothetical protein [Caudoviricetes sp.]
MSAVQTVKAVVRRLRRLLHNNQPVPQVLNIVSHVAHIGLNLIYAVIDILQLYNEGGHFGRFFPVIRGLVAPQASNAHGSGYTQGQKRNENRNINLHCVVLLFCRATLRLVFLPPSRVGFGTPYVSVNGGAIQLAIIAYNIASFVCVSGTKGLNPFRVTILCHAYGLVQAGSGVGCPLFRTGMFLQDLIKLGVTHGVHAIGEHVLLLVDHAHRVGGKYRRDFQHHVKLGVSVHSPYKELQGFTHFQCCLSHSAHSLFLLSSQQYGHGLLQLRNPAGGSFLLLLLFGLYAQDEPGAATIHTVTDKYHIRVGFSGLAIRDSYGSKVVLKYRVLNDPFGNVVIAVQFQVFQLRTVVQGDSVHCGRPPSLG